MGTKKIIIVDGCERNNTRYNGPIAAPVDIEMLVDGLNMAKEAISIKMELARELARMAGKVITKAGFNPKNFILDDEVTEEFFSANIGSNEDIEETLAFTMAGTDGFEYYAIASNHMEEDGHYASSVLFRYGKEKSQVFNIESYKWEDLPEEEIMPNEIKSILTEGGPTADFAEFILNLFDGVDAEILKGFIEANKELINLYGETQQYMDFEGIYLADTVDQEMPWASIKIALVPRDTDRIGICADYTRNKQFRICRYIPKELFDEGSKYSNRGYFKGVIWFDKEEDVASYLFKACNRYTETPVYTIPISKDVFVDLDWLDGTVVYTNKNGELTDVEKEILTPFMNMIAAD